MRGGGGAVVAGVEPAMATGGGSIVAVVEPATTSPVEGGAMAVRGGGARHGFSCALRWRGGASRRELRAAAGVELLGFGGGDGVGRSRWGGD
jgi:hypothetical protein